jgi:hypothetical protein
MNDEIFTTREVQAADGDHIKVRMVSSSQQDSNFLPRLLSTATVKIVVLDGDFNADNHDVWASEDFEDHVVRPRDKHGVVLTGKLVVKLENGEGCLHNVTFVDNSKFTRSGKFRLGVKIIGDVGEQVQEGISEPFTVKHRRGEGMEATPLEFCYGVYNQRELFICLDLMVKNREIPIKMYFKLWINIKLVWVSYQNY